MLHCTFLKDNENLFLGRAKAVLRYMVFIGLSKNRPKESPRRSSPRLHFSKASCFMLGFDLAREDLCKDMLNITSPFGKSKRKGKV